MKQTIAIILPVYNRTDLLKRAVDSVLGQTYQNFELIIVDDGSDLDIKKYIPDDKRIKVIRQKHRGVSSARNNGIKNCRGEYLCFLDSDDVWLPKKLEKQLFYMKKNPELLISQSEEIWIRNGKRVNPMKKHRKKSGDIFEASLELCLVSPSAVMIKRKLLSAVGLFDEKLPACEDYDLWLRIAKDYSVGLLPEYLIEKYGGHEDQLSHQYPVMDQFRIKSMRKLLKNGNLKEIQKKELLKILKKKCRIVAQGAKKRRKYLTWIIYLIRSRGGLLWFF